MKDEHKKHTTYNIQHGIETAGKHLVNTTIVVLVVQYALN